MNEENETQSALQRLVMCLAWLRWNWFRRIYMVSYTAPTAAGNGSIHGHQDIDLQYTWGNNRGAVAEYIAENLEGAKCKAVSITFVQRIGFVLMGFRFMTW